MNVMLDSRVDAMCPHSDRVEVVKQASSELLSKRIPECMFPCIKSTVTDSVEVMHLNVTWRGIHRE